MGPIFANFSPLNTALRCPARMTCLSGEKSEYLAEKKKELLIFLFFPIFFFFLSHLDFSRVKTSRKNFATLKNQPGCNSNTFLGDGRKVEDGRRLNIVVGHLYGSELVHNFNCWRKSIFMQRRRRWRWDQSRSGRWEKEVMSSGWERRGGSGRRRRRENGLNGRQYWKCSCLHFVLGFLERGIQSSERTNERSSCSLKSHYIRISGCKFR